MRVLAPAPRASAVLPDPDHRELRSLLDLLDSGQRQLEAGAVEGGMETLFVGLARLRAELAPESWLLATRVARAHPLGRLLLLCPLNRHAFARPRGYPGDAGLLDLIYDGPSGRVPELETATELGRRIFRVMVEAPAAQAVRDRRVHLAGLLDRIAAERGGASPRALSVACGHLREAALSRSLGEGAFRELVALDQDPASLARAERDLGAGGTRLRTAPHGIADLLADRVELGKFDLVYSAGLYDYLPVRRAQRLTRRLFTMLNPGGELVLFNFAPGIRDAGYMETYLRWELIYRTREEMEELSVGLTEAGAATIEYETDATDQLVILRARRG